MRTRLRQLRALLSLTDNEFYEYLSESSDMCPCMNNVVCLYVNITMTLIYFRGEGQQQSVLLLSLATGSLQERVLL